MITEQSRIDTSFQCDELVISGVPAAPEGKVLCMTVDGVLQDLKTGTYQGDIHVYVLDAMTDDIAKEIRPEGGPGGPGGPGPMMGPPEGMGPPPDQHIYANYMSAVVLDEEGVQENVSALDAVSGGDVGNDIIGGILRIQGSYQNVLFDEQGRKLTPGTKFDENGKRVWQWITDYDVGIYNGVTILGGKHRIDGLKIDYRGNGGDDFHMYGSAVAVTNEAKVVLDHCDIETRGVIATGVSAAARADVLVENSRIVTKGTSNEKWYKYNEKGMTSAAWVLAGRGTVRATNALGGATMTFYNTYGESNGWGVYSGDEAADIHQNIVNSTARIPSQGDPDFREGDFGAGYAVYALSNTQSNMLGVNFQVPDYAAIIAGGWTTHYVGPSTLENLEKLVGRDSLLYRETDGFTAIEPRESVIHSDNYGFLWHSNCSGTLNILPGTELHVGDTLFLIKGGEILSNSPTIHVSGAIIDNGGADKPLTIAHLMESDDAGQTDEIALHHDYKWAICHMSPDKHAKLDGAPTATAHFDFCDEKLDGNFYNSVNTAHQLLELCFDNSQVNGCISSGDVEHVNKSYWYGIKDGQKICIDGNGRAYQTLREAPYTSRSMGGASVTRVYVHPVVDEAGCFAYDKADQNIYEKKGYAVYYSDAQYISQVFVTPSETVNNPIAVSLKNGSVWNVTGRGFLTHLELDESSVFNGRLTVNGCDIMPQPGNYDGKIVVDVE